MRTILGIAVSAAMVATSGLAFAGSDSDMWDDTDTIGFTQYTDAEAADVKGAVCFTGACVTAAAYWVMLNAQNIWDNANMVNDVYSIGKRGWDYQYNLAYPAPVKITHGAVYPQCTNGGYNFGVAARY
ncbi:hypothetical protein ISS03_05470 [Patescibacteria group bacterium]|nr:hypothetical protein [Patescibacteria group bacterium]